MNKKDTFDSFCAAAAVAVDALAIFAGFMLATWIRFVPLWQAAAAARPPRFLSVYAAAAGAVTLVFVLVFNSGGLYARPQCGSFVSRIPRIVRCIIHGILMCMVMAFAVQNNFDVSRLVVGFSALTIGGLVLIERYILFRIEWNLARHAQRFTNVLVIGTDDVAVRLSSTLRAEPMRRERVTGFLRVDAQAIDPRIPADAVLGDITALPALLEERTIGRVILTETSLHRRDVIDILLLCERHLVRFNMVPDLFRVITSSMDVQSIDDIPLLGVATWPLDLMANRLLKRIEDVVGSLLGLVIAAPVMAVAAAAIWRESGGPILFRQLRCGEGGREFSIYKLRTMRENAEAESGPIFACKDDPRRTRVGAFLRYHNIDELPQLWNVLKGNMTLVGPRPERPHFVEQFKRDIDRYMWRHVSKPGMTGWAQVNGLRGDTSIEERIKYDLYYLEHWSLSFDFKILLRTFFARNNAY